MTSAPDHGYIPDRPFYKWFFKGELLYLINYRHQSYPKVEQLGGPL